MTVVGREVAAAEGRAPEAGDSVSTERHIRADALRNREVLITAAGAAFSAHGADVPLEDIAREAGLGIGTLYRHFPTRDSLVEAVYRHEVDVLCERADELLNTLPPDQALEEWMQLFVRHVATKRGMLSVLKPMLSSNPTFFAETKGRATAAATRLLEAGVAAGSIRADVDGGDLLRAVGGVCMSTDQDATDASNRLVGLLFDGLRHGATMASPLAVSSQV
ncbi:MAG: TetR/AcrR family transcriptional regulator [Candidatus Dormiibacterota bacterium]